MAALAATLRLYRNPAVYRRAVPVWQLLLAPLENLKLRAERLAPQLAESALVRQAEAVQTTTLAAGDGLPRWRFDEGAVSEQP